MASRTNIRRLSLALRANVGLFLLILTTFLPYSVSAAALAPTLPDLATFRQAVENGNGDLVRGVYAEGLFALYVVQQPSNNAAYVSPISNVATQFNLAAQYGNVGLLAHNYLSGQYFSQLTNGKEVQLIYGDGRIENFRITSIYQYQAISPSSASSDFIDLNTQRRLSATTLFSKVYMGPRHLTFQTCVTKDGDSSWGRLFVVAQPEDTLSPVSNTK